MSCDGKCKWGDVEMELTPRNKIENGYHFDVPVSFKHPDEEDTVVMVHNGEEVVAVEESVVSVDRAFNLLRKAEDEAVSRDEEMEMLRARNFDLTRQVDELDDKMEHMESLGVVIRNNAEELKTLRELIARLEDEKGELAVDLEAAEESRDRLESKLKDTTYLQYQANLALLTTRRDLADREEQLKTERDACFKLRARINDWNHRGWFGKLFKLGMYV